MNTYKSIETKSLLITLFIRFFSNRIIVVFYDIIMTTLFAIHTSRIDLKSKRWINTLIIYIAIYIFLNVLSIVADKLDKKDNNRQKYISEAYELHNSINFETANNLYRVNKKISKAIRKNKIEKEELRSIVDFQKLSFSVCDELYAFINNTCNCKECEISIFQRFSNNDNKDYVKMIAYRNSRNLIPSTYNKEFKLMHKSHTKVPVFIDVFNDLNAEVKILENKTYVNNEFIYFNDSKVREEKICQYIGIPIKTNRNKIEVVLQIDVSENNIMGSDYNEVKQFADVIVKPFVNLLYCSYERDLILDKFYDILEENINRVEYEKNNL